MTNISEITQYCSELLETAAFNDYCPNGLQVAGKPEIKKLISGVTASQKLIDEAVKLKAEMLLVHHGFFWKGEPEVLTGMKGKRISTLIQNGINLLAYHLPLDANPQFGNNAQLAQKLKINKIQSLTIENNPNLFWLGQPSHSDINEFCEFLEGVLKRKPLLELASKEFKRMGWCTGAAQDYIFKAIELGCDTFLTGEVSERTIHIARENNINFISAGHHVTERYGVKALGEHLAAKFNVQHSFVDIDNPV